MNNNLSPKTVESNLIFFRDDVFSPKNKKIYDSQFSLYFNEGKILHPFNSEIWECNNEVNKCTIHFSINQFLYALGFEQKFHIPYIMMTKMIRYYAVYLLGSFIFRTISHRIKAITYLLTGYGNKCLEMSPGELSWILHFLNFIGMPNNVIEDIQRSIIERQAVQSPPRTLVNIINYYAIHDAINDISTHDTHEFIQWFPIYFWCNVTFIIPLRPTEMLVTPYDCISRNGADVYLSIRRTKLKGNGTQIYYDVDRDYALIQLKVPDNEVIKAIEKYQKLTQHQPRRFLFCYSKNSPSLMLHLAKFNYMLEKFSGIYLVNNHKYDYARYASGVSEFAPVRAGDSRHLALSNMYFQGIGLDICRQLAGHTNILTTSGYCLNTAETIEATAIMKIQHEIHQEKDHLSRISPTKASTLLSSQSSCLAPEQPHITGNITPCLQEDCLESCIGCQYYSPSAAELGHELDLRKKKLISASQAVLRCISENPDKLITDVNKLFLDAHTAIQRYKITCTLKAKELEKAWLNHQNTPTSIS